MLKKWLTFGLTSAQEDRFRNACLAADLAQARISILLVLVAMAVLVILALLGPAIGDAYSNIIRQL